MGVGVGVLIIGLSCKCEQPQLRLSHRCYVLSRFVRLLLGVCLLDRLVADTFRRLVRFLLRRLGDLWILIRRWC